MTAKEFASIVAEFARKNNYRMRGNLWTKPDHYIAITCEQGCWMAEAREYKTGKFLYILI